VQDERVPALQLSSRILAITNSQPVEKPLDQQEIFGTDRAHAPAIISTKDACLGVDGAGRSALLGSGVLTSSGALVPAISATTGPSLGSGVLRGGCAALRAGCRGDTSPPAGCCMGTYASIWELVGNSGPNAESLPARGWATFKCSVWELLDFVG